MKELLKLGITMVLCGTMLVGSSLASSVADVKKKGELVLGTDATFPPFSFKEKGVIDGFDIAIARAIAQDLGVNLKISNVGFDALMPGSVTSGRVDIAISGITITVERKKVVGFSSPYFKSAQVFIVKKGNPKKVSYPMNSFKGKTFGVQKGTTGEYVAEDKLKKLGAGLKVYDNFAQGLADLQNGRIDAVLGDQPTVPFLEKAQPGQFQQAGGALKGVVQAEDYGVVFARGSDLAAAVNGTLERLRKSGEYQKLLERWIVNK